MNYHGQIMNIQLTSAKIGAAVEAGVLLDNDRETKLALVYKMGHRDARHDAAEIAASADAKIERLRGALELIKGEAARAEHRGMYYTAVQAIAAEADAALKETEE